MRRGVTLLELLVSMVLLGVVAAMAMHVFQYQHQNWVTESDQVQVQQMAKGSLDEIANDVRMVGAALPEGEAGIKVWPAQTPGISVVLNRTGWIDTALGSRYEPDKKRLTIALDSASNFSDSGYAMVSLQTPPPGVHGVSSAMAVYRLPIVDRIVDAGSCTTDSLALDASELVASPRSWTDIADVRVVPGSFVHNLDTVSYFKSNDSLFVKVDTKKPALFALGIDTLAFTYRHPVSGWSSGLSSSSPASAIDMVRIRLVTRTRKSSKWLMTKKPASRGYVFARMELDVDPRNDNLVNR